MAKQLIQAAGTYQIGSASPTELGALVVQTVGLGASGGGTIKFQGTEVDAATFLDVTYSDQTTQVAITKGTTQTSDSIWSVRADGMLIQVVVAGTVTTPFTLSWTPIVGAG